MPVDIEGWIEVRSSETAEWNGVEDIAKCMIFAGQKSDQLFGLAKHPKGNSVAANRGLPADISLQVKEDLESYRGFEKEESKFSFDEIFGFSYISYKEILAGNLEYLIEKENGWDHVFNTMKSIEKSGVKPESIRVVVWAIW